MHEFWTTPIVNMTYTRSQNYTYMMVGEHRIQHIWSCDCCVVAFVAVVWCFVVPTCAHVLLCLSKWLVQIHLNVNFVGPCNWLLRITGMHHVAIWRKISRGLFIPVVSHLNMMDSNNITKNTNTTHNMFTIQTGAIHYSLWRQVLPISQVSSHESR